MNGTEVLRDAGQRLWLDTISRRLLDSGTLQRYIDDYGVTGVTSNPTILSREIAEDERVLGAAPPSLGGSDPEVSVVAEAVHGVQRAADLFRSQWEVTGGVDGWVSIEVPPALAYLGAATVQEGRRLHAQVNRPNVFIKVPATWPGVAAIEALTVAGIPTNATLVFDTRQHHAVESSYLRGLERRLRMGIAVSVTSVASVFISRWDTATDPLLPPSFHHLMGLRVAHAVDEHHRATLGSPRWARLRAVGAEPQRLVWASTSPKDPALPPTYYAEHLPLRDTVNTMPEGTLLALGQTSQLSVDDGEITHALTSDILDRHAVNEPKLAQELQRQGVQAFSADWDALVSTSRHRVPTG